MAYLMLKNVPRYECILEASKHFPDLDPSACEVFLNLLCTADDIYHTREALLAKHELSSGRFMVLMQLLNKMENRPQPCTPAELAEMAGVTRATMTGLVDTLERDGLVMREPDPVDRRMMFVQLTPAGQSLLAAVMPKHFQQMAALMRPLSEPERKTLVKLLAKVVQGSRAAVVAAPA
jgi:DNA-binding MarR family transcriptional regulator